MSVIELLMRHVVVVAQVLKSTRTVAISLCSECHNRSGFGHASESLPQTVGLRSQKVDSGFLIIRQMLAPSRSAETDSASSAI
jgi:hypothetical protein